MEQWHLRHLVVLAKCPAGEAHGMCLDCAEGFYTTRVDEGRVHELKCPLYGELGCSAKASEAELSKLLSRDTFWRYRRFVCMSQDPSLRECPACLEWVRPR